MFGVSQSVILLYRMVSSSIYVFCRHKLFLHYLGKCNRNALLFSPRVKTNLDLKKLSRSCLAETQIAPGSAVLETKASSQCCASCWKLLPAGDCILLIGFATSN